MTVGKQSNWFFGGDGGGGDDDRRCDDEAMRRKDRKCNQSNKLIELRWIEHT